MKVVIANGMQEADYIIKTFHNKGNSIVVINDNKAMCEYLSAQNHIDVIFGNPTQKYILGEVAGIDNYDIFISLSSNDIDNYIACTMAKEMFNVKKCIATVTNPKNVELFKKLGIDNVINSSYVLGESIKNQSMMDNFIKSLSLLDQKIEMSEIVIEPNSYVIGKALKNLKFPPTSQICCVYREPIVIIPNGDTILEENDRIFAIYVPDVKEKLLDLLQRK